MANVLGKDQHSQVSFVVRIPQASLEHPQRDDICLAIWLSQKKMIVEYLSGVSLLLPRPHYYN